MQRTWMLASLVLLHGALACKDHERLDPQALRREWAAKAPAQYVARVCASGFIQRSCTVSAVDQLQPVETLERVLDGEWTPSVDLVDPVESLVASYASGPDGCKVTIEHDAQLGYPQRVDVECSEESYTRSIDCFIADTLDVSRCQ